MLTKEVFDSQVRVYNIIRKTFSERILEIINICKKHIEFNDNHNNDSPYFTLDDIISYENSNHLEDDAKNELDFYVDKMNTKNEYVYIIDKYGKKVNLNRNLLVRWLWEDFEEELVSGIELYENRNEIEKREFISRKEILESIKQKLSKEECKALEIDDSISRLENWIKR